MTTIKKHRLGNQQKPYQMLEAWSPQMRPGTPEPFWINVIRQRSEISVRKWGVSRIGEIEGSGLVKH
jgi:hypothetical protein